jgi:hypothetical protein
MKVVIPCGPTQPYFHPILKSLNLILIPFKIIIKTLTFVFSKDGRWI